MDIEEIIKMEKLLDGLRKSKMQSGTGDINRAQNINDAKMAIRNLKRTITATGKMVARIIPVRCDEKGFGWDVLFSDNKQVQFYAS